MKVKSIHGCQLASSSQRSHLAVMLFPSGLTVSVDRTAPLAPAEEGLAGGAAALVSAGGRSEEVVASCPDPFMGAATFGHPGYSCLGMSAPSSQGAFNRRTPLFNRHRAFPSVFACRRTRRSNGLPEGP